MEKTEYYLIVSVGSDTYNKWHRLVEGKRCTIETLEKGEVAWFMIEGISPYYEWTRFHTSRVADFTEHDEYLVIETRNSVYTLRRIENDRTAPTAEQEWTMNDMDFNIFNSESRKVRCIRNDDDVWACGRNSHLLEIGRVYTVDDVDVYGWHTEVYLVEIPNKPFNSVLFEEIEGDI